MPTGVRRLSEAFDPQTTLIVADEPVSMVYASLRITIVSLFGEVRDELKVSIISMPPLAALGGRARCSL